MPIHISLARSDADREAVFRLRYGIYVEEMGRPQFYADHARRRIEDPLDATALNLMARDGEALVGVVRVNLARDGGLGVYERFYGMAAIGEDHPRRTATCTRLMVAPERRGGTLAFRLAEACLRIGLDEGLRWGFFDCKDQHLSFFSGLGCRAWGAPLRHPEHGMVNPMIFDLADRERLQALRSPLAGSLRRLGGAPAAPRPTPAVAP